MTQSEKLLERIAEATRLREGPRGVGLVLWNLLQGGPRTLHELAQRVGLPIPVLAAVRRELEKAGILERAGGIRLSSQGLVLARELWGIDQLPDLVCERCTGTGLLLPETIARLEPDFRAICERRPEADVTLDQAHAVPETGLLRAALLLRAGALLSGTVAFLGDDDLTSVACGLVAEAVGAGPRYRALVLDIDPRYLALVDAVADQHGWAVRTVKHDYREPLPALEQGTAACVVADPPYTIAGLECVLTRTAELVGRTTGAVVLVCYPPRPSAEWLACQERFVRYGVSIEEVYPGANRYTGNSMHAHLSHLYLGRYVGPASSRPAASTAGIYTASRERPPE
jgi:predicted methyltransferase